MRDTVLFHHVQARLAEHPLVGIDRAGSAGVADRDSPR